MRSKKAPGKMGRKAAASKKSLVARKPIRPRTVARPGPKAAKHLPKVATRGGVSRATYKSKAPAAKRQTPATISFKPGQIRAKLEAQKAAARQDRQKIAANIARDSFKAKKGDRGKIVMVSGASLKKNKKTGKLEVLHPGGKRNPQARGKRGLLVYVTKTGKKRLVKQHGETPYKTRKITDIEPPNRGNLKKAVKKFQLARRKMISEHTAQLRGSGKVKTGGAYDFTDKASDKIAKTLKKTIEAQASKRSFFIDGMALVKLPGGKLQTIPFGLPIDKPDHIAIKLAGMKNFVRQKFYSFMAQSLAELGFVTAGSTNNIRKLPQNEGLPREEWTDKRGEEWAGAELQTVHLESLEWRIEQMER